MPPPDEACDLRTSNPQVIELSASALDSDPSLLDLDLGLRRGLDASLPARFARVGGWRARARAVRRGLGLVALAALGGCALVAVNAEADVEPFGTASLVERVTGVSDRLHAGQRAPNEAAAEHTALVLRGGYEPALPAGACALSGASRVLAKRAPLASGLDVSVLDGGFGVGFATGRDEALGMRLDGSLLRVAERAGGWIQVVGGGLATGKTLRPVPGVRGAGASAGAGAGASASAGAAKGKAAQGKAKGDAIVGAMMVARARAVRVVSPQDIDAGQPTAAAAPDGRALVAFFGAERGRPPSVLATSLACATGP